MSERQHYYAFLRDLIASSRNPRLVRDAGEGNDGR